MDDSPRTFTTARETGIWASRGEWRSIAQSRLRIDSRALATFRMLIGMVVIADLVVRWQDLRSFYTDAGVLPRSALAELHPILARLSIHGMGGSITLQRVLFVVAGLVAVFVVLGVRTRLTVGLLFVLHASLYARNPYVLNGGDGLLVLALFLSVFLPLGERWSVDAVRHGREPRTSIEGLASAVLLGQLVIVYLTNVAFKLQSDAWTTGNGARYALELEQFAVLLAPTVREFSSLVVLINWLWIAMLALSPLLIALRGWPRFVVVMSYIAAHVGMLLTLRLGLFPLVVIALLVLYMPSVVWNGLDRHLESVRSTVSRTIPTSGSDPQGIYWSSPRIQRIGSFLVAGLLVGCLLLSVAWPASEIAGERGFDPVVQTDGYTWTLFAPDPPTDTRWFVGAVTLSNGDQIDGFTDRHVVWEKPADVPGAYRSTLWHRYLSEIRHASSGELAPLATYLCREVSDSRDSAATSVAVYAIEKPIDAVGGGDADETLLIEADC